MQPVVSLNQLYAETIPADDSIKSHFFGIVYALIALIICSSVYRFFMGRPPSHKRKRKFPIRHESNLEGKVRFCMKT